MAEWAVVAIPADDNPIWRISSEKIPHMTLLYFGEQSDGEKATRVAEYLQHMVENTMVRFGLDVDFRGTLGPKDADVLFFHEDRSLRNVQDYRAHMLKDPDMFEMYHAIEQYPEWTAHLTLGYPDAPANPPDKDMPPGWSPGYVHFDRIALWTEDFDGVEFQIPWNKGMDLEVAWSALRHAQFTKEARKSLAENKQAMSDGSFPIRNVADLKNAIQAYGRAKNKDKAKAWIKKRAKALQAESYLPEEWMTDTAAQSDPVGEFIASLGEQSSDGIKHYGKKGMKWGVRNDRGHEGERATTKKIEKLDKNFEKKIKSANAGRITPEFHNAVVRRMNARVEALNESAKYRDVDLDTASAKIKADYEKDSQDVVMRSFEDGVREIYGSNASGTKKAVYNRNEDRIDLVDKSVKHADVVVPDVSVKLRRNKLGHVTSFDIGELEDDTVEQNDKGEEFIAHYGRKGMKWGIRRTQEQLDADSEDVTNVKTARAKIKANRTTDVLSNKELQQVVTRLNLEQQYSNLTTPKNKEMFKGENFIKDLVKTGKTVNDAVNTVSTLQNNLGPLIRDAASAASKRASHSDSARKKKVSTGSLKKSEVRRKNKNPYSGPIGTM